MPASDADDDQEDGGYVVAVVLVHGKVTVVDFLRELLPNIINKEFLGFEVKRLSVLAQC